MLLLLEVCLRLLEPLLVVSDALIEVIEQVRLVALLGRDANVFFLLFVDGLLEGLYLSFVLLNYFLTEVAALGKLFLNLLVVGEVPLQILNHRGHLVVLVHQVLRLLRLVLQLASQLHILDDSEFGGSDELLLIKV